MTHDTRTPLEVASDLAELAHRQQTIIAQLRDSYRVLALRMAVDDGAPTAAAVVAHELACGLAGGWLDGDELAARCRAWLDGDDDDAELVAWLVGRRDAGAGA